MLSDALLTAADVAQLLRLNVETVYTLIQKEGLPAAKIGGQWRFSESKIRAWFESRHLVGTSAVAGRGEVADGQGACRR